MLALTDGETEAWEAGGWPKVSPNGACLPGLGGWLQNLPCHQPWAGKKGSKPRAYLIYPWVGGREQVCSCLGLCRLRAAMPAGDAPTAQKGTLRWQVTGPPQEELWREERGVSFVSQGPSLSRGRSRPRGQKQQQPGRRTFPAERPLPQPGAQCQPETGRGDPQRPPRPRRRTLILFRRQRLTPPAGRERSHTPAAHLPVVN